MGSRNGFDELKPNLEGLSPEDARALQMYYAVRDSLVSRGLERNVPDEVVVYDSGGVRICGNGQDFEFTRYQVDRFLGTPTNGNGFMVDPTSGINCSLVSWGYQKPIGTLQAPTKYGTRQELKIAQLSSEEKIRNKLLGLE